MGALRTPTTSVDEEGVADRKFYQKNTMVGDVILNCGYWKLLLLTGREFYYND